MSLRAYALRRGVSVQAVSMAIKNRRLVKSVVRVHGQPKIADPVLADQEWKAATDLSRAPGYVKQRGNPAGVSPPDSVNGKAPKPGSLSLADASAIEKTWRSKLAELEYQKKKGEVLLAADIEQRLTDVILRSRTKLLGIPSRARQQLPHLTVADIGVLEAIVREALEEVSVLDLSAEAELQTEAADG